MTIGKYELRVTFLSNESPWTGTHNSYGITNDDEALEWARGMKESLEANGYQVTYFKDGVAVPLEDDADEDIRADHEPAGGTAADAGAVPHHTSRMPKQD